MKNLKFQITVAIIAIATVISSNRISAQDYTLKFDGSSSYASLGNIELPMDTALTVMAWVKWNITPADGNPWANMVTCNANNSGDYGRFWLQHNSNNHKFEFAVQTTQGRHYLFSSTNPQKDVWYHIAATFDGSQIKIYINGILESTKNHSGTIQPHENRFETHIGGWATSDNNYRRFNGNIDHVSIWNKALSEGEINAYMCDNSNGATPGLVAAYEMDEGSGIQIIDHSFNGFDMQNNGGVWITDNKVSCSTLPVILKDFSAESYDNNIILTWSTVSEINNNYFTIERSSDGINFETIGTVQGMGTSNVLNAYNFNDNNVPAGTSYYRLKQTDYNGDYEYFNTVTVKREQTFNSNISIYPNPAIQGQKINIEGLGEDDNVEVYDLTGSKRNIDTLSPGIYIVIINEQMQERLIIN